MRPDLSLLDLPPDPPSSDAPVTVFYDCEFTDLTSDAELLSIGFVASDTAAELYIEIADANRAIASLFVREEVLPLFGRHNPEVLTRAEAAVRVAKWFDGLRDGNRDRHILLVSDSDVDWPFFQELIGGSGPREINIVGRTVHMLCSSRQLTVFTEELEAYFRRHKGRHHALVDARALKTAFLESRFS